MYAYVLRQSETLLMGAARNQSPVHLPRGVSGWVEFAVEAARKVGDGSFVVSMALATNHTSAASKKRRWS